MRERRWSVRFRSGRQLRVPVLSLAAGGATLNRHMMETVLIVDDHAGFRAYAREMLESEGFRVVGEAPDAASAITAAQQLKPDIVLLDVHLPDLDGFRASKRIAAATGAPAIVLTSSGDVGDLAATAAECPAHGFIPKAELSGAAIRALVTAPT